VDLFDAMAAADAAEVGMQQAADHKESLLKFAKKVACEIGRRQGIVTADDVQRELVEKHKISDRALGNAAGSLFKGPWRFTGQTVKSVRVSSHGRLLRVWQYTGD
jgi:hypothetical protein